MGSEMCIRDSSSAKPLNSTKYLPTEVFDLPCPIKLTLNIIQAGPSFVYIFNLLKVVSVHHYQNNCVPYLAGFRYFSKKLYPLEVKQPKGPPSMLVNLFA